jgi:hypothetical protein
MKVREQELQYDVVFPKLWVDDAHERHGKNVFVAPLHGDLF